MNQALAKSQLLQTCVLYCMFDGQKWNDSQKLCCEDGQIIIYRENYQDSHGTTGQCYYHLFII